MFKATSNQGFQLTFENGNTVSVQWGPGSHGQRKNAPVEAPMKTECWKSNTAEVAAWDAEGNWHLFDHGIVTESLLADEVAEFIAFVAEGELTID